MKAIIKSKNWYFKMFVIIPIFHTILIFQTYGQNSVITIAEGEGYNTNYYPINREYNYNRWEALYLSEEIDTSGLITSIAFYKEDTDDGENISHIKVYFKQTDSTILKTGVWSSSGYILVFDGEMINSSASGWKTINLDTAFYYSDTSNLRIAIAHGYQPYLRDNYPSWRYDDLEADTKSKYSSRNSCFKDTLTATSGRPQIAIGMSCAFADAGSDAGICSGQSATLGGNPTATGQGSYYNYSWSPISGLNSSSTANPIATPTATTTYTVTVSGGGCNTSYTDQIIIYVNSDTTNYILDKSMDYKVCDGDFYDSGGTDPEFGYQNNEDYIVTFYPCESYKRVSIDFSEYFDIEENNDWLKIYNGPTEASTLIGTYDGVSSPGTFTSTHSTGALTFVFHSDESGTGNGWDAEISCTTPDCETIAGDATITDDGNGLSSGMASFQLSGNTGTFSTWQKSEISTDNYINISGSTINDSVFVNTTTNFRAVVIAGTTTCYSSVVTYLSSNNYFVNDDSRIGDNWCTAVGDENNDGCSNAKPDNLVSGIIENISLKAGDTIFIDAGDFTDAIHISPTDSGSSESNVVLLGAGSDNTVINASSEEEVIELNQTAYIEVRDISLSSEETNNVCLKISDSHYNLISNCAVNSTQTTNCLILGESASYNTDNNKIKNSTITNEQSDAKNIEVRGKCNSTVIQNNIITNLAEGIGSTGIYFNYYSEGEDNYAPSTGIIHNNYIKLNGTGIYLNGGDGESLKICNSTITQNMININSQDANETFAIKINYSGIDEYDTTEISKNWLKGAEKSIYLDNTIYADINCNYITNSNTGIHVNDDNSIYIDLYCNSFYNDDNNVVFPTETAANTWNFQNNILSVTSSEGSCIKLYQTNSSLQFLSCDYNLFDTINGNDIALLEATSYSSLNDWTSYDHDAGAGNGDANSLTGNPDFTSAENGNLSIYESSPASGAGIKIDGLDVDINNLTIDENDVAIGASNFQAYPGIDSPYGILKKKLDGSSYLVKRGYLKFKFTEEYFQDTGAALQFNIYDWERKLVYTTSTTTFDTDLKLGDNRYDWNFSICNSKLKYNHFYVLEVINNKDEKWYLKFKNTTPFYLRVCLFDIAPQTYIGGFFTSWP